jgi:hypothetical protein
MSDDLVKRLRDGLIRPYIIGPEDLCDAADRIEALTEQLEDAYARGFCAGQRALKDAGEFVTIDSPEIRDRIEALTAELDRVRDKYEAKDGMDGAVVYAIRRLLNEANVPLAAFIDDHVLNAIIQRNVAEAETRMTMAELADWTARAEAAEKELQEMQAHIDHADAYHKAMLAAEAYNARLLNDLKVISQFQATKSCTANIYSIWKMTERARAALNPGKADT